NPVLGPFKIHGTTLLFVVVVQKDDSTLVDPAQRNDGRAGQPRAYCDNSSGKSGGSEGRRPCPPPSGGVSGTAVLGQAGTASGPALEGPGAGAGVGEAEHEGHALDRAVRALQILVGQLFAQIVQHFLEGGALFLEPPHQGALGHVHQLGGG